MTRQRHVSDNIISTIFFETAFKELLCCGFQLDCEVNLNKCLLTGFKTQWDKGATLSLLLSSYSESKFWATFRGKNKKNVFLTFRDAQKQLRTRFL